MQIERGRGKILVRIYRIYQEREREFFRTTIVKQRIVLCIRIPNSSLIRCDIRHLDDRSIEMERMFIFPEANNHVRSFLSLFLITAKKKEMEGKEKYGRRIMDVGRLHNYSA